MVLYGDLNEKAIQKRERMHVYIQVIHFALQQKLQQKLTHSLKQLSPIKNNLNKDGDCYFIVIFSHKIILFYFCFA